MADAKKEIEKRFVLRALRDLQTPTDTTSHSVLTKHCIDLRASHGLMPSFCFAGMNANPQPPQVQLGWTRAAFDFSRRVLAFNGPGSMSQNLAVAFSGAKVETQAPGTL